MGTASALLMTLCVAAGEPLSADELQLAVAALEAQLSRLRTTEVRYRVDSVYTHVPPAGEEIQPPPEPQSHFWIWKPPKELFAISRGENPDHVVERVVYDGNKTYTWTFDRNEAGRLLRVAIMPQAPSDDYQMRNLLAHVLGLRHYRLPGGLMTRLNEARRDHSLRGTNREAVWTISLGSYDNKGVESQIEVDIDPSNGFRLCRWRSSQRPDQRPPMVSEYIIDEFQSVTDEQSGETLQFPLRARYVLPKRIVYLAIDSVRINPEVSDEPFAYQEPPFGTEVYEMSVPGAPYKMRLAGGEAALQQRMTEIVEQAEAERDRLETNGVLFDATPRSSRRSLAWFCFGVGILVVAWIFHRALRRNV